MTEPIMQKLKEHDQKFLRSENQNETLEADFEKLDRNTHKMFAQLEEQTQKLNQILEIVLHTNRMLVPPHEIEGRIENHENRLSAIEYAMRKNPEKKP